MPLEIIYEDDDIVAINKPAGVLFDWALAERPDFIPVHRLDRDTSGVILFAKKQNTADYLKNLFQTHQIQKTYHALVVGRVKEKSGVINFTIARSRKSPLKRIAVGRKHGKEREAITEYKVLTYFKDYTLVEIYPKTGRTHQIRTHFSAIGHPVACDFLYGGKHPVCPPGVSRQLLHAKSIELTLPSGTRVTLEADLPEDLAHTLQTIEKETF